LRCPVVRGAEHADTKEADILIEHVVEIRVLRDADVGQR
jgi:hypothetical protein